MQSTQHTVASTFIPLSKPMTFARLGYVGDCAEGMRTAELMSLYFDAYQRAMNNNLKGIFICDGNKLGGVIEGEQHAVTKVWLMIKNDDRNIKIHLFEKNQITSPIYEEWTMHVKDGYILNLMYPQCNCPVRDTENSTTEEVLGMMHSYANYLRQTN